MNQNHWRWSIAIIVMALICTGSSLAYGGLGDSIATYSLIGFLSWYLLRDDIGARQRLVMSVLLLLVLMFLTSYFACNQWLSQVLKGFSLLKLLIMHLFVYFAGMGLARLGEKQRTRDTYRKF